MKIWLHVKSSLNADEQRLEVQIGKVIEHDDINQPRKAKESGEIRPAALLEIAWRRITRFDFANDKKSTDDESVHEPCQSSNKSGVAQSVL